ncbi:D-3-phosphoglycerate dehydrogenase [Arsenophonus endosymbiont of Bemisia tabaci Q2]|nr:D-3-phosphoglycerate dehydrogenase [Arsenophonus endosymbiont of Bemisia tabaci Q2]
MLNRINQIFMEDEINIAAEYLQTTGNIGYVVIDITSQPATTAKNLLKKLKSVPGTIRKRLLY